MQVYAPIITKTGRQSIGVPISPLSIVFSGSKRNSQDTQKDAVTLTPLHLDTTQLEQPSTVISVLSAALTLVTALSSPIELLKTLATSPMIIRQSIANAFINKIIHEEFNTATPAQQLQMLDTVLTHTQPGTRQKGLTILNNLSNHQQPNVQKVLVSCLENVLSSETDPILLGNAVGITMGKIANPREKEHLIALAVQALLKGDAHSHEHTLRDLIQTVTNPEVTPFSREQQLNLLAPVIQRGKTIARYAALYFWQRNVYELAHPKLNHQAAEYFLANPPQDPRMLFDLLNSRLFTGLPPEQQVFHLEKILSLGTDEQKEVVNHRNDKMLYGNNGRVYFRPKNSD